MISKYLIPTAAFAVVLASTTGAAHAKGCLVGAAAGAAAGHVAGHHAVLGAVGGCIAGRHLANKKAKEDAAAAKRQDAPAAPPGATPEKDEKRT